LSPTPFSCLSPTPLFFCHAYKELFLTALSPEIINKIQQASTFSMPLGNNKFKQQIEEALKRKIGEAKLGRPKNEK